MFLHRLTKVHAPEFPDGLVWLNGASRTIRSMLGRPVLIDFWTYSCVNCLRTQPHMNDWHERYAKLGLEIIGVHTPEFSFEKHQHNVEDAIGRLVIPYPVILDNEYAVWNAYANHWWPRKFLIDHTGSIVYDHVGEGGYAETEMEIQKALAAIGVKKLPRIAQEEQSGDGVCYRTTPETYLGYLRGRIANNDDALPDAEEAFTDRGERADDSVVLHGHWRISSEYIEHARRLPTPSEYLVLTYSAFGVNLVAGSESGKVIDIDVELDGQPLPKDMAGSDVVIVQGRAKVRVKGARMYHVVKAGVYHRGTLKLSVADEGVRMFAFTFEGCA